MRSAHAHGSHGVPGARRRCRAPCTCTTSPSRPSASASTSCSTASTWSTTATGSPTSTRSATSGGTASCTTAGRSPRACPSRARAGARSIPIAAEGITTRGVLLDVAAGRTEGFVTVGHPVTPQELDETAARAGVRIQPGDAVVIRSGDEAFRQAHPDWVPRVSPHPGLHISCLEWFRQNDVAAVAWDMMDERPERLPGIRHGHPPGHPVPEVSSSSTTSARKRWRRRAARRAATSSSSRRRPLRLRGATGAPARTRSRSSEPPPVPADHASLPTIRRSRSGEPAADRRQRRLDGGPARVPARRGPISFGPSSTSAWRTAVVTTSATWSTSDSEITRGGAHRDRVADGTGRSGRRSRQCRRTIALPRPSGTAREFRGRRRSRRPVRRPSPGPRRRSASSRAGGAGPAGAVPSAGRARRGSPCRGSRSSGGPPRSSRDARCR